MEQVNKFSTVLCNHYFIDDFGIINSCIRIGVPFPFGGQDLDGRRRDTIGNP